MKKNPENVDPALPPRPVEVESILEPLNGALESVRAEANNLAEARKTYETKVAGLKSQKASMEQKLKDLQTFELDVASDPTELALEINATRDGIILLARRLTEAEKGVPADASLKTAWGNFDAEFHALKGRIVDLHYHQTCVDLAKICELPSEYYENQDVKFTCPFCYRDGSVHTQVPTGAGIVLQAHSIRRANCLSLRNRKPTEDFVEIAEQGLANIREEIERIDNLEKLPPYEKPEVAPVVSAVLVASKPTSTPKPQRGVDARPPDFKTALHPMGRGMIGQAADAEERNRQQLEKWKEDGILPADAGSHQLQVNAYMPKK